jgi:hypothetical protein
LLCSKSNYRPGPEGELPGFVEPGLVDPGFGVPGLEPGLDIPGLVDPPFGDVPGFEGEPGVVGLVFGVVPGVVPFGFVVDGCVGLPGVFGLPGVPDPALPVGGAVVLPVGGAVVLPVGGADGDDCPGVAEPPLGAAAPGAAPAPPAPACAITQVPQHRTTDNNINFFGDILRGLQPLKSLAILKSAGGGAGSEIAIDQV